MEVDEAVEMKPTIHLSVEELPEIKNWETGKEYQLKLKVKQVGKNEHEHKGKTTISGSFEVLKAKGSGVSREEKAFDSEPYGGK